MALALRGVRGSVGVKVVSTWRGEEEEGEREGPWVTWCCALLEGMAPQRRVERLKAERVRQSLRVAMVVMLESWEMSGLGGLSRGL